VSAVARADGAAPSPLSRAAIAAVDAHGMLEAILDQPAHLHDALRRAREAEVPAGHCPREILVCGMGGSAIGGDLAAAALAGAARAQLRTLRDYEPDSWVDDESLAICASYSGNTEETLSCYDGAGAAGARRVAITAGGELQRRAQADGVPVISVPPGLQPRAAVCYMLVSVLHCAARSDAAPDLTAEVPAVSVALFRHAVDWGPDAGDHSLAKRLARGLHATLPVVYGAGPTVPVALRWKAQLNENPKLAAFQGALPEVDHNEICAWEDAGRAGACAVFLQDEDQHARIRRRVDLTANAVMRAGAPVIRVSSIGTTRLERLMSLVFLGDLVSLYLAVLRGVDPTPVEAIERFKRALG
jgi:glucose/mannose-6-phosphate isomerase